MNDGKELQTATSGVMSGFSDNASFELIQRMAKMLATSKLVPITFQNNVADCVIGIELANRLGAPVLSVLQSMYIVHGKPSWSSQFLIATLNASRRFATALRFEYGGENDEAGCFAWAKDYDGREVKGPRVTLGMAKKEGWLSKAGSKWQTMPELMLSYRAATFFCRLYAPELTMGLPTQEEIIDISGADAIVSDPKPNMTSPENKLDGED